MTIEEINRAILASVFCMGMVFGGVISMLCTLKKKEDRKE